VLVLHDVTIPLSAHLWRTDVAKAKNTDREPSAAVQKAAASLQSLVMRAVQEGVGPVGPSVEYAEDRLARYGDVDRTIQRIVNEATLAAASNGFVTGLGGLVTVPVALPVNVAGAMIINARMVGAIAHLRGYDLDDPHTQAVLMLVVAGSSAQAAMSTLGVKVGVQAAKQAIKAVPMAVIVQINKKAGFYLVAKYGTKRSAITLVKFVPGVGGIVGGSVDAGLTRFIGISAKKAFAPGPADLPQEAMAAA
jgi:hypothetical protein